MTLKKLRVVSSDICTNRFVSSFHILQHNRLLNFLFFFIYYVLTNVLYCIVLYIDDPIGEETVFLFELIFQIM